VKPSDTVVELWPGGGWYTEILAPYLASGGGRLYAAAPEWGMEGIAKLKAANPALYGSVLTADFPTFDAGDTPVPAGSADVVLTFRNVHNWRMGYRRDDKQDYSLEAFRQIYAMLKPGGTLGIVDHRLPEDASDERERTSGYIKLSTVRRLAEAAGFRLVASSEINANPADSADWPDGVWTLPPSLRLKDKDREKYLAIGESDRMTLRFEKPRR
jgi:predicted methyltransferase